MAHYEHRSKNTYRLVIDTGLDSTGKRVRKRKTIKLDETLTPTQREKELKRQLVLFEEEVKGGNYLDGEKITFAEFTQNWLKNYAEVKLAPTTLVAYKQKLNDRILPALGHMIISKLQPQHLLQFYQSLHEQDIRLDSKYMPTPKFIEMISAYSNKELINLADISSKSCNRLKRGMITNSTIAQKVCTALNFKLNKMFTLTNVKTLSEKTVQNHMGIICSILSTALRWNIIKDNPMLRIDMKKVQKPKAKYYDDKQVTQMLEALDSEPLILKVMVYLSVDIGLRRGELTGLTWDDINFKTAQISIHQQRHYIVGYGIIKDKPKTEAGTRVVTASQTVIKLLKKYRNHQRIQKLKLGTAWKNEPYVFVHDDGTPINTNLPYKWFVKFLGRHNLPRITFHQLRHTNASILIASGEDVVTVSSRLGHADKSITLNTYSHMIKGKEVQAANKMDGFYKSLKVYHI